MTYAAQVAAEGKLAVMVSLYIQATLSEEDTLIIAPHKIQTAAVKAAYIAMDNEGQITSRDNTNANLDITGGKPTVKVDTVEHVHGTVTFINW